MLLSRVLSTFIITLTLVTISVTLPSPLLADEGTSKKEDIKKLLITTGIVEQGKQLMQYIMTAFAKQAQSKKKQLPEEFWTEFSKTMITEEDMTGFIEKIVPIYDKYFTHAEIKEINKVFQNDVFKKWIRVSPQMMKEGQQAGSEFGKELASSEKLKTRLNRLLKKHNIKK